jgi:hypothetical protein
MRIVANPSEDQIKALCEESPHYAAKWVRDTKTGDMYYAPAGDFQHAHMAAFLHLDEYEKGLAVPAE